MAAIPPAPAAPVAMLAPPRDFDAFFSDPTNDTHGGNYGHIMGYFTPTVGVAWDEGRVHHNVVNAGIDVVNAYIGLFEDPTFPAGRTRLLHTPSFYPTVIGRTSGYDGRAYAFLDDVASGVITTVNFPSNYFGLANNGALRIYNDPATLRTAFGTDAHMEIVEPVPNGAGTSEVLMPHLMFVPPKYAQQLLGRRLTPRQLLTEFCQTIEDNGDDGELEQLIHWCIYACTKRNNGDTNSELLLADVTVPIGDPTFLTWRQRTLHRCLPGLDTSAPAGAVGATIRIAALMQNILDVQRSAKKDAEDARKAANEPKSVGSFFKDHLTTKLLLLCNVASEADLPPLWSDIAAANGKRDREAIELCFRSTANAMNTPELAPVVTPALAKKLSTLRLAGTNLDDLSEGVHPFVLMIQDHTTAIGSQTYTDATNDAADYDDLMRGQGAADLADLRALKASTKVLIPETYALARAMLQSFVIVMTAMLGETHPQTLNISRFTTAYVNRENFYIGRLQRQDPNLGPARLLRYVQLAARAWFQEILLASDAADAASVPSPDYRSVLQKMNMGDMTWLPEIPEAYLKPSPVHEERSGDDKKGKGKDNDKKPLQILNTAKNPKFDEFRSKIATVKFNEVIRKAGQPPNVHRNGKDTPMCASYHLRGQCWANCPRRVDHAPHSEGEDSTLYEWCKRAFE